MQLEHLRYLQTVAECGSMNKAARLLFCSQPAVTNAIRSLEEELGSPLLTRTAQGVIPTAFGQIVLQDTQMILGCADRWKRIAIESEEKEPVSICLTGTAPRYHLMECILRIRRAHPELDIRLRQAATTRGDISFV